MLSAKQAPREKREKLVPFRLPPATRRQLAALADALGCSRTAVVCRAIAELCARQGGRLAKLPPGAPAPVGRPAAVLKN